MHNFPIIAITGSARAGKNTLGEFILSEYSGYLYGFADPIRAMLAQINVDMNTQYYKDHKEENVPWLGKSPRQLMQTLGTEWGRNMINPDIWVNPAKEYFKKYGPGMIITDLRFENEAKWVREAGGLIIHIMKPLQLDKHGYPVVKKEHESEQGIKFDYTDIAIVNGGTLEDLQQKAKQIHLWSEEPDYERSILL